MSDFFETHHHILQQARKVDTKKLFQLRLHFMGDIDKESEDTDFTTTFGAFS